MTPAGLEPATFQFVAQVGLLFFNYHNDARSNIHKIVADIGMDWTCSKSKQEGSRIRARPRLRWLEDTEKDLREMKVT